MAGARKAQAGKKANRRAFMANVAKVAPGSAAEHLAERYPDHESPNDGFGEMQREHGVRRVKGHGEAGHANQKLYHDKSAEDFWRSRSRGQATDKATQRLSGHHIFLGNFFDEDQGNDADGQEPQRETDHQSIVAWVG